MNTTTGSRTQICIVGTGAQTAVGLTAPSAAAAIRAGIPGFGEHPFILDQRGEPMIVARVPGVEDGPDFLSHHIGLAAQPAREAISPLAAFRNLVGAIPLFLGLPPKRPGRPADLESRLADAFRREIGISSTECIATGHAAGLMAVEAACRKVVSGSVEFCVAGGVDSYLEADTLEWLEANDQLHGGPNPYGFIPGEAAGFCVVCTQPVAERFHLPILARVETAATSRETNLIKTESVCLGQGLTKVFDMVFAQLPSPETKIGSSINDMNGEPYRADEYGFTVARLSQRFEDASDFVAPADCWGDVGAASGPLFVNLVVAARQRGYAQALHNLVWTSSESGERCAAILQSEPTIKN
jgi:3-oxoacyl-[acyl-carrier-protein] synthase I